MITFRSSISFLFEFQDFADSHTASGHEFKHESIPRVSGSENDLIDYVLFQVVIEKMCDALRNFHAENLFLLNVQELSLT